MINIINSFFGSSGYSSHGRSLANALNKLTKVKISTNLNPGWETQCNDAELEMIKREEDYEINLIITHPLHWKAHLNAKRHMVYLIWEGDKIPQWMLEECLNDKIEKIICPSTHTRDALWMTCGDYKELMDKVVVIPHGVDLETFYPINSPARKRDEAISQSGEEKTFQGGYPVNPPPFKFLANKGLRNLEDRGGLQYLIKAYLEEFTESCNVELVLKINPAYGVPNLLEMFPNLKEKGIPKITFIHDNYTNKQLNELYNSCDVFVSPTRAEAFNLPVLESAACKKTSITTAYGGQCDFITKDNGWLIDYKLAPVTHEIEYENCMWATPSHEHLRKLLRYAFTHQDEVKQKGEKVYQDTKHLTWDSTAQQIKDLI